MKKHLFKALLMSISALLAACSQPNSTVQKTQSAQVSTTAKNDSFNYQRFINIAVLSKMDSVNCYVFNAQVNAGRGIFKENTLFTVRAWAETENWGKFMYFLTPKPSTDPVFRLKNREQIIEIYLKHLAENALPFLREKEILAGINTALAEKNYSFDSADRRFILAASSANVEIVTIAVYPEPYERLIVDVEARSTLPIPD